MPGCDGCLLSVRIYKERWPALIDASPASLCMRHQAAADINGQLALSAGATAYESKRRYTDSAISAMGRCCRRHL